jgi:hypothetical protein
LVIELRNDRPPPKTPPKFLPRLLSISQAAFTSLVIISPRGRRTEFTEVSGAGIAADERPSSHAMSSMPTVRAMRSACCVPRRQ